MTTDQQAIHGNKVLLCRALPLSSVVLPAPHYILQLYHEVKQSCIGEDGKEIVG